MRVLVVYAHPHWWIRHWLEKRSGFPFRFIPRLQSVAKPIAFLRRVGKPLYVHIPANVESWLFLKRASSIEIDG